MKYRREICIRDEGKCVYCGKQGHLADHVLPRSLGGRSTDNNLVWCCRSCNAKKKVTGDHLDEYILKAFQYLFRIGVELPS